MVKLLLVFFLCLVLFLLFVPLSPILKQTIIATARPIAIAIPIAIPIARPIIKPIIKPLANILPLAEISPLVQDLSPWVYRRGQEIKRFCTGD